MSYTAKALMMVVVGALAACTSPDRFDNDVNLGGGGAHLGTLDPSSPAYFNQTIGDRVHFAVDQATLSDQARATLRGQAGWLMNNPDYVAVIEGHADEQGTREYNLALGARRANAVREFLQSQGVSAARLKIVSYGKERPLEICSNEACYTQNRRAVTIISGGLIS